MNIIVLEGDGEDSAGGWRKTDSHVALKIFESFFTLHILNLVILVPDLDLP